MLLRWWRLQCSRGQRSPSPHRSVFLAQQCVTGQPTSSMRAKGATDDSAADHLQKNETCSQAINHLVQDRHLGDLLILNVGQSSRWTVADAAVHTSIGASIGIGVDAAGISHGRSSHVNDGAAGGSGRSGSCGSWRIAASAAIAGRVSDSSVGAAQRRCCRGGSSAGAQAVAPGSSR